MSGDLIESVSDHVDLNSAQALSAFHAGCLSNEIRFRMELLWLGITSDEYPPSDIPWDALRTALRSLQESEQRREQVAAVINSMIEDFYATLSSESRHEELSCAITEARSSWQQSGRAAVYRLFKPALLVVSAFDSEVTQFCYSQMNPHLHGIYTLGRLVGQVSFPDSAIDFLHIEFPETETSAGQDGQNLHVCTTREQSDGTESGVDTIADVGGAGLRFLLDLPLRDLTVFERRRIERRVDDRRNELGVSQTLQELRSLMPNVISTTQPFLGTMVDNCQALREGHGEVTLDGNQNALLLTHFINRRDRWTSIDELVRLWPRLGGQESPIASTIRSQITKLNKKLHVLGLKVGSQRNVGYRIAIKQN